MWFTIDYFETFQASLLIAFTKENNIQDGIITCSVIDSLKQATISMPKDIHIISWINTPVGIINGGIRIGLQ